MQRFHFVRLAAVLWTVVGIDAAPAVAQKQKQVEQAPFSTRGRFVAYQPGLVRVQTAAGPTIDIKIVKPGETEVTVGGNKLGNVTLEVKITGELSPEQLQPRMVVRFTAPVDDKGNAQGDLREITMFDPRPQDQLGLFPEGAGQPGGANSYLVKGVIVTYARGQLSLNVGKAAPAAPRGRVSAKLADDARVIVESENLQRARPGDEIAVEGIRIGKDVVGNKITVTVHPVGGKKKPAAPKKPDAGKPDAGKPDAGKPDAGKPDPFDSAKGDKTKPANPPADKPPVGPDGKSPRPKRGAPGKVAIIN
jgi:hypothetical protein